MRGTMSSVMFLCDYFIQFLRAKNMCEWIDIDMMIWYVEFAPAMVARKEKLDHVVFYQA